MTHRLHLNQAAVQSFPSGRPFILAGMMFIYAGASLATFKVLASRTSFLSAIIDTMGLRPGVLVGFGVAVIVFWWLGGQYISTSREKDDSRTRQARPDLVDVEYESELEQKGPHVLAAYYHLSNIRFQQNFTAGWSGTLKLPIALEGTMKSDRSWLEKPRSLPDIVDDYKRFLEQIVGSDKNPYDQVLICIDELDKLASDEAAERFLNGIKSIFNQKNCYYLVSVSENAMSSFERRGLPIRDAFDSSFDEVIYADYQLLSASKRLLSRRVLNLPDPYICLAHILSGGLPRDLLRACRAMFDARAQGVQNNIAGICRHVVSAELQTKLRAIVIAAERDFDTPKSFISQLLSSSALTSDEMWSVIVALRSYQIGSGRATKEPIADGREERIAKISLPSEALILTFFFVTVLQVFERLNEESWKRGEMDGSFERMALIRRSLSQDPSTVAGLLDGIRAEFKLSAAEECLNAALG